MLNQSGISGESHVTHHGGFQKVSRGKWCQSCALTGTWALAREEKVKKTVKAKV